MRRRRSQFGLILIDSLLIAHAFGLEAQSDEQTSPAREVYDCGTLSLYYLLRLEGRSVELPQLESVLPRNAGASGYNMEQLRDAARA
jgi:hypothetical protein